MSASSNRIGVAEIPTTTTAGSPGTSDQVREFTRYVRPCYVTNTDGTNALFVRINGTDTDPASATVFDVRVAPNTTIEITSNGIINVKTISLFMSAGAYSTAIVSGWLP